MSQFLKNGLNKEDIVLKSDGKQFFSYLYITDTVSGIFEVFFNGKNGEAYNISDENSDITLKNLADKIASYSNKKVIFQLPDDLEKKGYSTATKARLCNKKLLELGWKPKYNINTGIKRTLDILSSID